MLEQHLYVYIKYTSDVLTMIYIYVVVCLYMFFSFYLSDVYVYKKMWYGCHWYNSPSKSQFVKVNHHRSKYGFQHGALAHTEQQAIKGHKHEQC